MAFDLAREDTICAPATASGEAALAVVRVSGRDAASILGRTFRPRQSSRRKKEPEAFRAVLGEILNGDVVVDEAFCIFFPAGRSYTGESSFELSLHGSPGRVAMTLSALENAGCRLAEAGEFTLRAVLSGRIDLTAAEAVAGLIAASTESSAQAALRHVAGELGQVADTLAQSLITVLAELESRLDYPDEDLGAADRQRLWLELEQALLKLDRLLEGAALGRRLTEGTRIVLYGRPNAGKSTLLNALLGEERAIVHAVPGTTRDVLEAQAEFAGWPCALIDVAGIRESEDVSEVEALGIERARREIEKADLVLRLHDVTDPEPPPPLLDEVAVIEVTTKADLAQAKIEGLAIAALAGQGLPALRAAIVDNLGGRAAQEEVLLTRERQVREVRTCRDAVAGASQLLQAAHPDEVVCGELRLAASALDRLLGRDLNEEILSEVFSRFCVGK